MERPKQNKTNKQKNTFVKPERGNILIYLFINKGKNCTEFLSRNQVKKKRMLTEKKMHNLKVENCVLLKALVKAIARKQPLK